LRFADWVIYHERKLLGAGLAVVAVIWALLLARLSWLNALLVTGIALVALGSVVEPLVGVAAALFLGPLWAWLRAELPIVPPLIGQYVFLLTVAIWLARGLIRRRIALPAFPLLLPLLGFMGVALLSLWEPADAWVGFLEWAKWGQILLMVWLVYEHLQAPGGERRAAALVAALALVALFQAGVGLWQFGLRGDGPDHFAINARLYRAYGTFEQPNPYGGFLGMLAALLAGIAAAAVFDALAMRELRPDALRIRTYGWLAGVACLGVGSALAASWSRGAWMGFGAALLVLAAALPRRGLWGIVLVALVVLVALGLYNAGLLPAAIADRMTSFLAYTRFEDVRGVGINDANYAVLERMAHWQAALEMWRARFWLGVGFGCYEPAYSAYRLINWPFALGHAHNYYLNMLAETGLLGLVAYLLFLGSVFWGLWRASRRLAGWQRGLTLGLVAAWAHFAVHSLVDNLLVNNVHLHLGALLALSAWLISERLTAEDAKNAADK